MLALIRDLSDLADLSLARQDYKKAVALWEEAGELRKRPGIDDEPDILAKGDLAEAYEHLHWPWDVLITYQAAIDTTRHMDCSHPLWAWTKLAALICEIGGMEEALGLLREALDATRRNTSTVVAMARKGFLAQAHAEDASLLEKLGWLRRRMGDWQAVAHSYEEALAIRRERNSALAQPSASTLVDLASTCYYLSVVYGELGKDGRALNRAREAMDIALGPLSAAAANEECAAVGGVMIWERDLAGAHERIGDREAARGLYREAEERWRRLWLVDV